MGLRTVLKSYSCGLTGVKSIAVDGATGGRSEPMVCSASSRRGAVPLSPGSAPWAAGRKSRRLRPAESGPGSSACPDSRPAPGPAPQAPPPAEPARPG